MIPASLLPWWFLPSELKPPIMGLNHETRQVRFAFPSESAEPAKLLVLVININAFQVTFKIQEDIQNCVRHCSSGVEMVDLDLVYRKTFLDTFHCQLHAITNYSSPWDIVTSFCRLSVFGTGIADTLGKMLVWKTSTCSPSMMGECRCYVFSSLTSCSSHTSAILFAEALTAILILQDGLARIIQT